MGIKDMQLSLLGEGNYCLQGKHLACLTFHSAQRCLKNGSDESLPAFKLTRSQ